jgi:hypothetical protein
MISHLFHHHVQLWRRNGIECDGKAPLSKVKVYSIVWAIDKRCDALERSAQSVTDLRSSEGTGAEAR